MNLETIKNLIEENEVRYVDLRLTGLDGKEQHLTIPIHAVDENFWTEGKMFDASSIRGFKGIQESDMVLMPDIDSAVMDPFYSDATMNIRCNVIEPNTMLPYQRCPRALAARAEHYLRATGIADACYFGPEPEFFIFDDVRWSVNMHSASFNIDSIEGAWNSATALDGGNMGHRPGVKGGYFPVPPVDSSQDIRSAMCNTLEAMGLVVEVHHHEVATGNQNEIGTRFNTLQKKADEMQIFKYVVHNVAHLYGKTATFMPKPLVGDNGSGMHCHQSLMNKGVNLFSGENYAGLSETALYYVGGIIKHARALNALTNPATNSYKRLVPGYEAPVMLAYSARNRSASIRVPFTPSPKGRRIEVRFPDPLCNPYLAFSAMMMAGLDGIQNKIHPGEPIDKDLYHLPPEEARDIPTVADSLFQALDALDADRSFLLAGEVFSNDIIDAYIDIKAKEAKQVSMMTHPLEFELYYSS
jgi:glutamine synthetase